MKRLQSSLFVLLLLSAIAQVAMSQQTPAPALKGDAVDPKAGRRPTATRIEKGAHGGAKRAVKAGAASGGRAGRGRRKRYTFG